jgi:adenylate cyclase
LTQFNPRHPQTTVEDDVVADAMAQTELALRQAERDGLRIALVGRTAILSVLLVWLIISSFFYGAILTGVGIAVGYLAAGILLLRYLARGGGMNLVYVFVAVEIVALGVLATQVPLVAAGGVPQIFIFRIYGVFFVLPLIASWALALSPGLVLWAGAVACATLWGAFLWIVGGMASPRSWGDFPPGGSGADYVALVLSPDFVGQGSRAIDTFILAGVCGLIAYAVQRARGFVRQRAFAEGQRLRAMETFGQYVPPDVAERLVETVGGLAPRTLHGSVLFADIAGFTRFSEAREPADVIRSMTEIFDIATDVVIEAGGIVAGFAGDAMIASFTLADDAAGSAKAAMAAATLIQTRLVVREFDGTHLTMRIGVASGRIAAGTVGGGKRRAYTVYGDPVNLSQRLQELAKTLKTNLLICDETWRLAQPRDSFVDQGVHEMRGREGRVRVFGPLAAID